ncbi:Uncharacterised protein [Mycobacteroides abscessus subsp. massiliense]|nr:Uncharacterised protein [Mycobacteroides abscessus subsp. massiliense]
MASLALLPMSTGTGDAARPLVKASKGVAGSSGVPVTGLTGRPIPVNCGESRSASTDRTRRQRALSGPAGHPTSAA